MPAVTNHAVKYASCIAKCWEFLFSLISMMDSLGTLKDKIVITMAMIPIFHISFESNVISPGFMHIALFINHHLAISSIFILLKLEALLGSQLTD